MPSNTGFLNIAHRGASSYAPENTFVAFDRALAMGVDHAELDVHLTSDDQIVVIHDDRIDRTTNGSGPVADFTLAELKVLDAGTWFSLQYAGERIRSFSEILEHYKGRIYFHVEVKARPGAEGLATRTADMIRAFAMTDQVTITSFWKPWLEETRAYAPELLTGWLVPMGPGSKWDDSIVEQSLEMGLTQVCPRADITTPELVEMLHSTGFEVRCHGIFDEALMRHAVDCGADGMTINFPDKLVEYLKEIGR
ncbi:MAG: glycerophosphodiester phosphodiesterase family protein [SAR202 cluster bacterium]|jgi:glycerophosphoryl diester phosphodiesterase|nr:glycerophosphodiester phosphodiesterase family protein [SAR202 cluster bacterium]